MSGRSVMRRQESAGPGIIKMMMPKPHNPLHPAAEPPWKLLRDPAKGCLYLPNQTMRSGAKQDPFKEEKGEEEGGEGKSEKSLISTKGAGEEFY